MQNYLYVYIILNIYTEIDLNEYLETVRDPFNIDLKVVYEMCA